MQHVRGNMNSSSRCLKKAGDYSSIWRLTLADNTMQTPGMTVLCSLSSLVLQG